jgi:hypothetical protein
MTEQGFSAQGAVDRPAATWSEWSDVFRTIVEDLSGLPAVSCPNCGAQTLGVAFYGPSNWDAATGFLWCDTCLQGISASRMEVPEGAEVIPVGTPPDEWPVEMPDYTVVRPTDDDFVDDPDPDPASEGDSEA